MVFFLHAEKTDLAVSAGLLRILWDRCVLLRAASTNASGPAIKTVESIFKNTIIKTAIDRCGLLLGQKRYAVVAKVLRGVFFLFSSVVSPVIFSSRRQISYLFRYECGVDG